MLKNKNLDTIFGIFFMVAVFGMPFFFLSGDDNKDGKELENKTNIPEFIKVGDETIDLKWTDDNEGEDLIIQSDKKSYFGIDKSEIYFSITNTNKKDQKISLRFLLASKEVSLKEIHKIEGEKENKLNETDALFDEKEGFISSDYFGDTIKTSETNYYKAEITYDPNSEGEFYIEAKGDNGAYGLLDPWYNSTGLVGYWSFDGDDMDWSASSAEVIDSSGNSNSGDVTGDTSAAIGKVGQALEFDGSGDYVSVSDDNSLDATDELTAAAWIKKDSAASTDDAIAGKWTYQTQGSWGLQTSASSEDDLQVFIADSLTDAGNNHGSTTSGLLTDNEWHHVLFVYDGNGSGNADKLKIYINGSSQTVSFTGTIPSLLQNSTAPINIGAFGGSLTRYWDGKIDEVAMFNRALSAEEISDLYNLGKRKIQKNTPNKTGLLGHWSMDSSNIEWGQTSSEIKDTDGNTSNDGDAVSMDSSNVVDGKFGQALDFDGSADYAEVSYVSGFNTDYVSTSAWVNFNTVPGPTSYPGIITRRSDVSYTESFMLYATNSRITYLMNTSGLSGGRAYCQSGVVSPYTWYHATLTYDGTTLRGYLNGSEVCTAGKVGTLYKHTNPVIIGAYTAAGDKLDGKIDEARLYNRALSSTEVSSLYSTGSKKMKINTSNVDKLTSGLVGHWTFDGPDMDWSASSAEVLDRSGNSHDGDALSDTKSAVGTTGQAVDFDGTGDYIAIADHADWDIGTGDFTTSYWINMRTATQGTFFSLDDYTTGIMTYLWGGDIYTWVANGWTSASWVPTANKWYHVIVRREGGFLQMYIDGTATGTGATRAGSIAVTSNGLRIGYGFAGTANRYVDGRMDEVRLYDRALSADEIAELYKSGSRRVKIK